MPQNRFIAKSAWATLYYVRKVFFEAGVKGASSLPMESGAHLVQ